MCDNAPGRIITFHIRPQDICIFDHAYVAAGLQGCVQLRRRLCCNGIMQYMKQSCLSHHPRHRARCNKIRNRPPSYARGVMMMMMMTEASASAIEHWPHGVLYMTYRLHHST